MSKCKAVLDGDKITEIRVKIKEGKIPPDAPVPESPGDIKRDSSAATQKTG
jgi:hypothetical protein